MFRILAPHVIVPLSLNGLLIADHLDTIVLKSLATMCIVELDELIHHLIVFHVSQRLVFHVAIDVSRRHVRVVTTLHEYFYLQMFILVDKVCELL